MGSHPDALHLALGVIFSGMILTLFGAAVYWLVLEIRRGRRHR